MRALYEILEVLNNDPNLNSNNIVEKIEKALGSKLIELASQLGGTRDREYDILVEKLRSWRKGGFLLNHQFDDRGTLLHVVAGNNYVNIIKPLKDKGADINIQNERRRTPLHEAAKNSGKEAVLSLIQNGADVNAQDEDGSTPLHFVRNAELTELLVEKGANVNEKNRYGSVPLHEAVKCKINILELAIKTLSNFFTREKNENISLHDDNHINTVKALLKARDIDVNAVDESGMTPLQFAVLQGCTDTVKALLKARDINVNVVYENGMTPLQFAVACGYTDIAKVILQTKGADIDINITDGYGNTFSHVTAKFGDAEIVTTLLKTKKISANAIDKDGCTLLHSAAQYGNVEAIDVLVHEGIDVNAIDKNGSTSLHYAAKDGKRRIIDILMLEGADPSLKDKNGITPIDLDKSGYIKKLVEKKAVKKGSIVGCSTAVLGAAIAAVIFTTDTVTSKPSHIISTVIIVSILAFAAGRITYEIFKPSTKMEEVRQEPSQYGTLQQDH